MSKHILSFDCASKSLAYTLAVVDIYLFQNIENDKNLSENFKQNFLKKSSKSIISFSDFTDYDYEFFNKSVKIIKSGVINMISTSEMKSINNIFIAKCLKQTLDNLDLELSTEDIVLIEEQPLFNHQSSFIEAQLAMYYADYDLFCVSPRLKNKLTIGGFFHQDYIERYGKKNLYKANKEHSKDMAAFLFLKLNSQKFTKIIDEKNLDDQADSLMQIFAWIKYRN